MKSKSTVNKAGNYTKPTMRKRLFNRIKAGGKGGKRCFVHTAFGKPNFLLDLYSEATQARVTKQNQKSEYVMRDK